MELTITDQAGPGDATKRTVNMIVADRKSGSIRSSGQVVTPGGGGRFAVSLNVDAMPVIVKDSLMRLDMSLEYVPKPGSENASSGEGRGSLNERLSLLVDIRQADDHLPGLGPDVGSEDLRGTDGDDPEVATLLRRRDADGFERVVGLGVSGLIELPRQALAFFDVLERRRDAARGGVLPDVLIPLPHPP